MKGYKSPKKVNTTSGRKTVSKSVGQKGVQMKSNRYSNYDTSDSSDSSDSDSSSDSSDSSSSEDLNDDDMYLNKNKSNNRFNRRQSSIHRKDSLAMFSSEDEDDNYSSSSEEEDIDYVQLTKQRRMKAMKAVKGLQKDNNNSNNNNQRLSTESAEEGELIEQSDSELDDDLVDAVLEKEEKKLDTNLGDSSIQLGDDLDGLNFDFDFNDEDEDDSGDDSNDDDDSIFQKSQLQTPKEEEEDIGEVVDDVQFQQINTNNNIHVEMKVPKFDEKELNSDDDYDIDNNELIQTLMVDNDDSELHIEGDDDDEDEDDFDKLAASRRQYTPGSEREIMTTPGEEEDLSDADSDKLMALETKAMVDDYYENQTRKLLRRGSIYRSAVIVDEDDDDLELDRLDNFEEMFPKQQASFRRRSSILDQSLLSSSDDGLAKFRTKTKRKKSKKSGKKAEIRRMLGPVQDGVYFDAIESDSNDDTNLVLNILSKGDDSEDDFESCFISDDDDDETDEDIALPKKSTKRHKGSKHAKEVLSSSSVGFGAPPLGTFTTKKPYSVIDGVSTRFVQPFESPRKKRAAAALRGVNIPKDQGSNPLALDELLNIDEFEEENNDDDPFNDPAHDHESNDKLQEMFGERRIPLTAFRNKGLVNKLQEHHIEALNSNKYGERRPKKNKKVRINLRKVKQEEQEQEQEQEPQVGSMGVGLVDEYIISNQDDIDGFAALASDDDKSSELVLIDMKKGRKNRLRRVSMVEAQKEGMRATNGGVFDEDVMENVESFLVDVGAGEEFGYLLAND